MFLDLCGTSVENNPCEEEGGCKTMCLLAPGGGRTCTCPENFELASDGVSCQSNCLSSMFVCNSTYKCIPFWWKCDTQVRIIMYYFYCGIGKWQLHCHPFFDNYIFFCVNSRQSCFVNQPNVSKVSLGVRIKMNPMHSSPWLNDRTCTEHSTGSLLLFYPSCPTFPIMQWSTND